MTRFTLLCVVFELMLGAFLLGGCASEPQTGLKRAAQSPPINFTQWHPDMHPELRIGLNPLNNWRYLPDPTTVYQP